MIAGLAKLDTGMTVGEAIARASAWWDKTGRKQITTFAGDKRLPSGILAGLPWEALDKREKLAIVKVWHHFNVRRPDLLGVDRDSAFKLGGEERVR